MVATVLPVQPVPTLSGLENQNVLKVELLMRSKTGVHADEPLQSCQVFSAETAFGAVAGQVTVHSL